jgi:hypothetical protein
MMLRFVRRPDVWLPGALLLLAAIGGPLLLSENAIDLTERERGSYGVLPSWRTSFDALSAACGSGLLTYDLYEHYTPTGRGLLLALGVCGALAYLVALRQALGALWGKELWLPSYRLLFAAVGGLAGLALMVGAVQRLLVGQDTTLLEAGSQALAMVFALGWWDSAAGPAGSLTILALLGGAGWWVWLWPFARDRLPARRMITLLVSYVVFLAIAAGTITLLESPRGTTARPDPERLDGVAPAPRYARAATLVSLASTAGATPEPLAERAVGEGTKLFLALVILVGGVGGTFSGGAHWLLLLWSAGRGLGAPSGSIRNRARIAAAGVILVLVTLTGVTAISLLAIEQRTASTLDPSPSAGDAILEAASAVGGANVSAGLTADLSAERRSRGIRQETDTYHYGMAG